jgi:hypothetical protein
VLGGADLAAAIHAHATWRRAVTGPHVVAAILVVMAGVHAAGRQRRLRRALQSAYGRRDAGPSWIDPPS